jgi:hypothetical protein
MHISKSRSKGYKKAVWSINQKLQVVTTYLALGNMNETAIATGVPIGTCKLWKTMDWFKDFALKLQAEDVQQLDSNLRRIVDKSLRALEDRIDLGDAQFDQKTGKIRRVPIKAHVALKITSELLTKREKALKAPEKESLEKTIDDRLLRLSEEFARFASGKKEAPVIDVPMVEVVNVQA